MESRSRASPEQFAALLEFMESHGDLSRPQQGPQGRIKADRLWQELGELLNSLGGGVIKPLDKWKKVWADWKTKTKKKALVIRCEASGTGGGPSSRQTLTASEERLLGIMGLTAVIGQAGIEERGFDALPSERNSLPPPTRDSVHTVCPSQTATGEIMLDFISSDYLQDAFSRHRRQAVDDVNYDDPLLGDEASDDEAMNDTEQSEPQPEKIPAIIETTPTQYEVEGGVDVRLECKVTPEKGTVVAWHKNNQQYFMGNINLHNDVRYSIAEDSKDLIIKNAEADDSGVFRCETVQKVPVAINHTLLVLQKPKIINMTASNGGILGVGADLTVTCYITASPVPTVLWSVTKKDQNERLTEKDAEFHVEGNVYSIHIKGVKRENSGQYYCYAINKLGSHQAETSVVVNGKPQVHVPKSVVNSDIQIEAVLQCAAHGDARPHFRWYKDGVLIEDSATQYDISTRGSHSNLTVSPSADADFGTFTCEAENGYGTHNRSIELVQSPVVEDLDVDGPKMTWTVHSHQPVEEMEVQLKSNNEDGEWTTLSVPVPAGKHNKYDISYTLEDKQLQPGEYMAAVKVKNTKSWGGTEAAVVKIQDPQSLYIQTASVYRKNAAHSIRPVYTALSTILMYLLVRML